MQTYLLINDDPEHVRRWRRFLEERIPNVFVAQCTTVHEALEYIERVRPTVLLLDIELTRNGREGLDIARTLRTIRLPVKIYSTSAISEFHSTELAELGVKIINLLDVEMKVREMVAKDSDTPSPSAD